MMKRVLSYKVFHQWFCLKQCQAQAENLSICQHQVMC